MRLHFWYNRYSILRRGGECKMENIYLKTKRKETCNGCTACAYVCPKKCIEMKEDNEGFIYPTVDESKCIHCGKCLTVCSNTKEQNEKAKPLYYACINNNKDVLMNSTSGGVFYALLKELFSKQNAVCYGAAYDENLVVKHMRAETLEDSLKFMGSKYARSDILGVYEQVKEDLKNNQMFSESFSQKTNAHNCSQGWHFEKEQIPRHQTTASSNFMCSGT